MKVSALVNQSNQRHPPAPPLNPNRTDHNHQQHHNGNHLPARSRRSHPQDQPPLDDSNGSDDSHHHHAKQHQLKWRATASDSDYDRGASGYITPEEDDVAPRSRHRRRSSSRSTTHSRSNTLIVADTDMRYQTDSPKRDAPHLHHARALSVDQNPSPANRFSRSSDPEPPYSRVRPREEDTPADDEPAAKRPRRDVAPYTSTTSPTHANETYSAKQPQQQVLHRLAPPLHHRTHSASTLPYEPTLILPHPPPPVLTSASRYDSLHHHESPPSSAAGSGEGFPPKRSRGSQQPYRHPAHHDGSQTLVALGPGSSFAPGQKLPQPPSLTSISLGPTSSAASSFRSADLQFTPRDRDAHRDRDRDREREREPPPPPPPLSSHQTQLHQQQQQQQQQQHTGTNTNTNTNTLGLQAPQQRLAPHVLLQEPTPPKPGDVAGVSMWHAPPNAKPMTITHAAQLHQPLPPPPPPPLPAQQQQQQSQQQRQQQQQPPPTLLPTPVSAHSPSLRTPSGSGSVGGGISGGAGAGGESKPPPTMMSTGLGGIKFPVPTPLAGPIYSEREKSAMEKAAARSTMSSAFLPTAGSSSSGAGGATAAATPAAAGGVGGGTGQSGTTVSVGAGGVGVKLPPPPSVRSSTSAAGSASTANLRRPGSSAGLSTTTATTNPNTPTTATFPPSVSPLPTPISAATPIATTGAYPIISHQPIVIPPSRVAPRRESLAIGPSVPNLTISTTTATPPPPARGLRTRPSLSSLSSTSSLAPPPAPHSAVVLANNGAGATTTTKALARSLTSNVPAQDQLARALRGMAWARERAVIGGSWHPQEEVRVVVGRGIPGTLVRGGGVEEILREAAGTGSGGGGAGEDAFDEDEEDDEAGEADDEDEEGGEHKVNVIKERTTTTTTITTTDAEGKRRKRNRNRNRHRNGNKAWFQLRPEIPGSELVEWEDLEEMFGAEGEGDDGNEEEKDEDDDEHKYEQDDEDNTNNNKHKRPENPERASSTAPSHPPTASEAEGMEIEQTQTQTQTVDEPPAPAATTTTSASESDSHPRPAPLTLSLSRQPTAAAATALVASTTFRRTGTANASFKQPNPHAPFSISTKEVVLKRLFPKYEPYIEGLPAGRIYLRHDVDRFEYRPEGWGKRERADPDPESTVRPSPSHQGALIEIERQSGEGEGKKNGKAKSPKRKERLLQWSFTRAAWMFVMDELPSVQRPRKEGGYLVPDRKDVLGLGQQQQQQRRREGKPTVSFLSQGQVVPAKDAEMLVRQYPECAATAAATATAVSSDEDPQSGEAPAAHEEPHGPQVWEWIMPVKESLWVPPMPEIVRKFGEGARPVWDLGGRMLWDVVRGQWMFVVCEALGEMEELVERAPRAVHNDTDGDAEMRAVDEGGATPIGKARQIYDVCVGGRARIEWDAFHKAREYLLALPKAVAELRNRRRPGAAEPAVRALPEESPYVQTPTTANSLASTAQSTDSNSTNETRVKMEEDVDGDGQTLVIRPPPKDLSPMPEVPAWKKYLNQDGWQSAALVCDMMISAATTGPRGTPTPHPRASMGLSPRKPSFKSLATPRVSARDIFDTPKATNEKSIPRISMEPEPEPEPSKIATMQETEKETVGEKENAGETENAVVSPLKIEPEEDELMGEPEGNAKASPQSAGAVGIVTEIEDPLAKVRSSFGLPPRTGLRESSQE